MDNVRLLPADRVPSLLACTRCGRAERPWDQIAGKAYCPDCQEALIIGEAPPLKEPTEPRHCAVCDHTGTVCYVTFPLALASAVAVDLCPEHLRGLLGRRLGPNAFHQLRRQFQSVGVAVDNVFLMHEAFYDAYGRALQPAVEVI